MSRTVTSSRMSGIIRTCHGCLLKVHRACRTDILDRSHPCFSFTTCAAQDFGQDPLEIEFMHGDNDFLEMHHENCRLPPFDLLPAVLFLSF